ncbi:peptidoglycan editing factor PgeF [uncultured Microscilla sp.]|uniref:peptidoglycan editing factor PgeF n=1 Tax=uncultured Microscilla sp. TaxID=432653 RepID=UPI00261636CB|nr:peptidoglycan editing factor PgeF [uncultured Microscilla sp.]
MIEVKVNSTLYFKYTNLSQYKRLIQFVSTRKGGVSNDPGKGLNVGFHIHDAPENVIKNREILATALNISPQSFCFLHQVHSNKAAVVSTKDRGRGTTTYEDSIADTDALVTNIPGICLNVLSADCVGILFYDPVKKAIGAAHSGWKGTVKKIAAQTIQCMHEQFGSEPKDILVGLGAGISPEVYEVGEVVVEAVQAAFGTTDGMISHHAMTGKAHFDLWAAIKRTLTEAGVPADNIECDQLCTYRHPALFFSYRRDQGKTGRFVSGIMLQEE